MEIQPEILIFLMSMLPVWELRGSIPVAIYKYGMTPFEAFFWAFLGNFFAGALLVLTLDWIARKIIARVEFLQRIYRKVSERTETKHREKIEKLAEVGIFVLVALPLPGTGAWTGALAATVFELKKLPSILSIGLGLIACGAIVLILSQTPAVFNL